MRQFWRWILGWVIDAAIGIVIGVALAFLAAALIGCNWQGQRHTETWVQAKDLAIPAGMPLCYKPDAWVKVVRSEWWSMSFCWVERGVEKFTKTQYYTSGEKADLLSSDPNSIAAAGKAVGESIGTAIREGKKY